MISEVMIWRKRRDSGLLQILKVFDTISTPHREDYGVELLRDTRFRIGPFEIRAQVVRSEVDGKLVYRVIEPDATLRDEERREVEKFLDDITLKHGLFLVKSYRDLDRLLNLLNYLDEAQKYYAFKRLHLLELTPVLYDENIEEINILSNTIAVRDRELSEEATMNVTVDVDYLFNRLALYGGKQLSYVTPTIIFSIQDLNGYSHRVSLTYAPYSPAEYSECRIRCFNKVITPVEYIARYRSILIDDLADLILCVLARIPICIYGEQNTGKTTFVNQLAFFIPPEIRINVIGMYKEIHLPRGTKVNYVIADNLDQLTHEFEAALTRTDAILVNEVLNSQQMKLVLSAAEAKQIAIFAVHAASVDDLFNRIIYGFKIPRTRLNTLKVLVEMGLRIENGRKYRFVSKIYFHEGGLKLASNVHDAILREVAERLKIDIEIAKLYYDQVKLFLQNLVDRYNEDPAFREQMSNYRLFERVWPGILAQFYRELGSSKLVCELKSELRIPVYRELQIRYDQLKFCPYCGAPLRQDKHRGVKVCPRCQLEF
ncbi:MAG: hypothetical protein DRJ40_10875 [Thermoprotei archaeon]|nr:MAG: hypothetical protein DRJ40_10875 [Thermoprotei archaeon]